MKISPGNIQVERHIPIKASKRESDISGKLAFLQMMVLFILTKPGI